MFKLLIVEDEMWEREGLKDFLDWAGLGAELSDLAADGIEGLEKARELKPDIIITDIKMPGMDGLKMSQKIREFLPNVKIIILTGYDDFKFAKEAININAFAYVLKPVEEEEMLSVMAKAIEECRRDLKKSDDEKVLKGLMDKELEFTKQRLLSGLLREKGKPEDLEQLRRLNLLNDWDRYAVIAVGLKNDRTSDGGNCDYIGETPNCNNRAYVAGMPGYIRLFDCLPDMPSSSAVAIDFDGSLFVIAGGKNLDEANLTEAAGTIADSAYEKETAAGIGSIVHHADEIYISCRHAREALNFCLFWGESKIASYRELEGLQNDYAAKFGDFLMKGNYYTKQLLHSLRSSDEQRMDELLAEMFRLIYESKWADRNLILNFLYGLLNEASLLFYNTSLSDLDEGTAGSVLLGLPDYLSIKGCVYSFFEKAFGIIKDKKSSTDEYVVRKVEQIVRERYNTEISLKTIAAEIYLSPNYLGSTFKKSTGKTFNDYLCQFRMEKARELLQSPKNRVSKVAAEVGIPSVSYFCLLFRDTFGIAPGEYQEMMLRK